MSNSSRQKTDANAAPVDPLALMECEFASLATCFVRTTAALSMVSREELNETGIAIDRSVTALRAQAEEVLAPAKQRLLTVCGSDPSELPAYLSKLGPLGSPALLSLLRDRESDTQLCALRAIAITGIRLPNSLPLILELTRSNDKSVRFHATRALRDYSGEQEAVVMAAFAERLGDSFRLVRVASAQGLAEFGPKAGKLQPLLEPMLHSRDTESALVAACTLAKIGARGPQIESTLLGTLNLSDDEWAAEAAAGLGALGRDGEKYLGELTFHAGQGLPKKRKAARAAITQIMQALEKSNRQC